MNSRQAEDYIYSSFLRARGFWDYDTPDSKKRKPELTLPIIKELSVTPAAVVTGSKGKGSVAVITSAILGHKLKVGLYTSPHISEFRERIRINGRMIDEDDFIKHLEKLKPEFDKIAGVLSPFEFISPIGIQVALALSYFNEGDTDFNILEGGKGIKYDDVNNATHDYAVINTIFLEHIRELGKTIDEIAEDKSHVITGDQKKVIVGPQSPQAMRIIRQRAKEKNVELKIYGEDFRCENISYTLEGMVFDIVIGNRKHSGLKLPLLGEHQAYNAALAIALSEEILGPLNKNELQEALASVKWPGRMQILSSSPFIMIDACINTESAANVKKTLDFLNLKDVSLIVGIPDDKDYMGVVKTLKPYAKEILLTKSSNPHYKFTSLQYDRLVQEGIKTYCTSSTSEAVALSVSSGYPVVILGTTSVIGEIVGD